MAPVAAAETLPIKPEDGVLLLLNGQTLSGKITRAGDRYYVVLPSGSINLLADDVLLHCRDLQEAYRRQHDASPGRLQDHLKLATWCLQNNLPEEARSELNDAAAIDADDPKIGVLRRRLELSRVPTVSRPVTASRPTVSSAELDRLVQGLPREAVERFATEIQPLLLNHCAVAACHGAQAKDGFRLLRLTPGSAPTRRLTQRNLSQALEQIDRDNPAQSRLLRAAREPHPAAHSAILDGRQTAQYHALVEWVRLVAQQPRADRTPSEELDPRTSLDRDPETEIAARDETASSEAAPDADLETLRAKWYELEGDSEFRVTADGTILMSTDAGEPVGEHSDRPPPSSKAPIRGAAGMANRPKRKIQHGAAPRVTPRDPFDPELFNRQSRPPR